MGYLLYKESQESILFSVCVCVCVGGGGGGGDHKQHSLTVLLVVTPLLVHAARKTSLEMNRGFPRIFEASGLLSTFLRHSFNGRRKKD